MQGYSNPSAVFMSAMNWTNEKGDTTDKPLELYFIYSSKLQSK